MGPCEKMISVLSIVLPKGSLEKPTLELFAAADLAVQRGTDRDYHAAVDDPRIDRVRFLRPQEIPTYLEQGLFDLGIAGRDWIDETHSDVESLAQLEYSRATSRPANIVVAVPQSHPATSTVELPEGVRVSTEYPELTRRFFAEAGVKAVIVPSYGATEAKVPDIVDAIVDVTETGSSLRRAGLKIIDTMLVSLPELIANKQSYADPAKRAAMEDVALLLRSAIRARGRVLLKLNVDQDDLSKVLEVIPSAGSPTLMPLASGTESAVEAVVPKKGINELIPALKAAGARDILELPIGKIVD